MAPSLQAQVTESFTFTNNRVVPDGNAAGLSDPKNLDSAIGKITSMKVRLKIAGEFNGDLYGYLRQEATTSSNRCVLINRSGKTATNAYGYADSGFDVTFQDDAPNGDVHVYQNVTTPADCFPLTGIWQPDGRDVNPAIVTSASVRSASLASFISLNPTATWTLFLADLESGGTNQLVEWGLDITGVANPTLPQSAPADIADGPALGSTVLNASLGQPLSVAFPPATTNVWIK